MHIFLQSVGRNWRKYGHSMHPPPVAAWKTGHGSQWEATAREEMHCREDKEMGNQDDTERLKKRWISTWKHLVMDWSERWRTERSRGVRQCSGFGSWVTGWCHYTGNTQVLHQAAQRKHCHLMSTYCVPGIKISALLVGASSNHHFNSIYW